MSMPLGTGGTQPTMSEINVTPLVDVVLVLLIIFMVTAPILQTGIEVQLPQTRTVQAVDPEQRAVITISREELLFYGSQLIHFEELGDLLRRDVGEGAEPIFLQADEDVRWKTIVSVVDAVRQAGFERINLVTRPYRTPGQVREP
ncbi:MAG TPA: biopolymer transporter ExbD [Acidobacteriota bacterium]|nr:biopolymer transporter ExbD [Acidobacteriota bacterium]HRR27559.1 biopolymer transporter ExbD [Acidobacteriota bacterium]HRV07004.1 biopolymer transporter ExbD [Acidobacteriota bacterium]